MAGVNGATPRRDPEGTGTGVEGDTPRGTTPLREGAGVADGDPFEGVAAPSVTPPALRGVDPALSLAPGTAGDHAGREGNCLERRERSSVAADSTSTPDVASVSAGGGAVGEREERSARSDQKWESESSRKTSSGCMERRSSPPTVVSYRRTVRPRRRCRRTRQNTAGATSKTATPMATPAQTSMGVPLSSASASDVGVSTGGWPTA
mmetsp:Transcript_3630/g.9148  ORF Transcript_3630/g.9148 Transcript_3630/m.9148 type:complete len:207 (+) Transcript_3630:300-920(+)